MASLTLDGWRVVDRDDRIRSFSTPVSAVPVPAARPLLASALGGAGVGADALLLDAIATPA